MHRRDFLQASSAAAVGSGLLTAAVDWTGDARSLIAEMPTAHPPAFSTIPVVGDGKWIENEPPQDKAGYYEPRPYDVKVGIKLEGTGAASQIKATTPVPIPLPEQKIDDINVKSQGCQAAVRRVGPNAAQLVLAAGSISRGQVVAAVAEMKMTLHKQYHAYQRDQFPAQQEPPKSVLRAYGYDTAGIQTKHRDVRELQKKVGGKLSNPWDQAKAYYQWVWENIRARVRSYTSVLRAIRDRVGDCEERAAVFVALCRASGIPARLVWVPNHNWAEFYLQDEAGRGHWIPAHTAAYSWFGWTGAHELVIQKGDNVFVPEKRQPVRLLPDWLRQAGARPDALFPAEVIPLPPREGADPGPGARRKTPTGEWKVIGRHALDKYARR